jgi:hypothetical protein
MKNIFVFKKINSKRSLFKNIYIYILYIGTPGSIIRFKQSKDVTYLHINQSKYKVSTVSFK